MARTLPVCALLILLPCAVRADDAPKPTVVRLTVSPQAAPKPALRYQLLPELREMNPGNPIQGYLICFMEQSNFFNNQEAVEDRSKWEHMPLKDLPVKELRDYGGAALRQADYSARLDTPDWQLLLKLRRDGIGLLIPDAQVMRGLATALKVRFRAEVAERRFDDALVTAKTMFALSRHLGEHPSLIGDLIGMAIGSLTVGPLEEMIQQPGCPNLYWALTDLPTPFIDLRKGCQGEVVMVEAEFRLLDENAPMNDAQLKLFLDRVRSWYSADTLNDRSIKGEPIDWVAAQAKNEDRVRAVRKRLIESGLVADKVKQFPAQQVILLDEKLEYEIERDERLKIMALPYWEAEKLQAAAPKEKGEHLFALVPALLKIRQARARLDQRLALLRCVEALRMYAAENDGKLPAKLSDVKLPLPMDPITGKPFLYQLDGDTAILRGTPPTGMENRPGYDVRYEVTIVK
ncbi:MAG TPA: hypothetical protein DDY78_05095 [Planctomycetales bacterium]|jgi:hypothetical protein|nr:hypothetical protein [Planctomycetales bacterium]